MVTGHARSASAVGPGQRSPVIKCYNFVTGLSTEGCTDAAASENIKS